MKAQLLISAEGAQKGKTVFTMGLLWALKKLGLNVQSYKCGPNSVDALLHTLACGAPSVNLDLWMSDANHIRSVYNTYGDKVDVCIVEGDKGLYDGFNCMKGSSGDIARTLRLPVVLVMDARSASYSVAPVIYGFKHYRSSVQLIGVIFNQVSSVGHYAYLKQACLDAGVECLGYLPVFPDLNLPSIHQGIAFSTRQVLTKQIEQVAEQVARNVDLKKLLSLSTRIFPCPYSLPYTSEDDDPLQSISTKKRERIKIVVARDSAFFAIFQENLALLEKLGNITYVSLLHAPYLPDADLYYFPGGSVEMYARQLYRNKSMLASIREKAEGGSKILAEDGAFALLGKSLSGKTGQSDYEMANVIPVKCSVDFSCPRYGYRKVRYNGIVLRGYESNYINCVVKPESCLATQDVAVFDVKGIPVSTPFYRYKNVIATLVRLYWGNIDLLKLWEG